MTYQPQGPPGYDPLRKLLQTGLISPSIERGQNCDTVFWGKYIYIYNIYIYISQLVIYLLSTLDQVPT